MRREIFVTCRSSAVRKPVNKEPNQAMTRHSLDCPTALVIFQITHEDRAGQTGTATPRYGEIVTMDHEGQAVIAAEDMIIRCPASALHPVDAGTAARWQRKQEPAPDCIAVQELVRFIPAQDVPFTLRWLDEAETRVAVHQAALGE